MPLNRLIITCITVQKYKVSNKSILNGNKSSWNGNVICSDWEDNLHVMEMSSCMLLNTLINWLCENGETDKALDFIDVINTKGYDPDVVTYPTLIKGLCKKGEIKKAMDFVDVMISKGLDPDDVTYCTLIEGLRKEGEIE